MKKQKLYSLLALSSLALSNGVITFAEDVIIGDSAATTVKENPVAGTGVVIGEETAALSEAQPVVEETNQGVVLGEVESTVGSESSSEGILVEQPKSSEEVTVPSTEESSAVSAEVPSEPVKETINSSDVQATPVVSDSTPLAINTDLVSAPVVTQSGETIVATQDGQVVVQKKDGTTEIKTPEAVGAKKQSDGTVVVKSDDGKLKVLPSTGEEAGYRLVVVGFLILVVGVLAALGIKKDAQEKQEK